MLTVRGGVKEYDAIFCLCGEGKTGIESRQGC